MKFQVIKTSDHKTAPREIEINTLEELITWCDTQDSEIIIQVYKTETTLEIYDTWRE